MTTIIYLVVIVVACFAAYLVYMAAEKAMRHISLGPPKILSFAVAMMSLLAILELGRGIILLILIPYAALGIALLTLYLLSFYRIRIPYAVIRAVRSAQQFLRRMYHECRRRLRQPDRNWRDNRRS